MPGYFDPFVYGPDNLQFVDGSVVESNPTGLYSNFEKFAFFRIYLLYRNSIIRSITHMAWTPYRRRGEHWLWNIQYISHPVFILFDYWEVSSLQHPMTRPAVLRSGVVATDIEEMSSRTHFAVKRWVDMLAPLQSTRLLQPQQQNLQQQQQNNQQQNNHQQNNQNLALPTPMYPPLLFLYRRFSFFPS